MQTGRERHPGALYESAPTGHAVIASCLAMGITCYNRRMVTQSAFRGEVREALLNLYDYERLRQLPLGAWLGAEPGYAGPGTLRQVLLDAIEALRPERGTPVDTPSWRIYHILFYRFVQGMSVGEVASQLGFGERHLRRHQARAIRALADVLWQEHSERLRSVQDEGASEAAAQADSLSAELAWLESERAVQQASLAEVLAGAEGVVNRLLKARGVELDVELSASLPPLSIHPLALRQVLVNVLSYAVGRAASSRISVGGEATDMAVDLRIAFGPVASPEAHPAPDPDEEDGLSISRRLLAMCGGRLQAGPMPDGDQAIAMQIPISQRLPVLIVDDNADTAALFTRYLADSRYRPLVARNGQQALALAQEARPRAIVLDVMMPAQDGWEVLSLLKTHPLTEGIPVVVATILTERELALSLGAADFLHKPVSQAELLGTLDRLVE